MAFLKKRFCNSGIQPAKVLLQQLWNVLLMGCVLSLGNARENGQLKRLWKSRSWFLLNV